MKILFILFFLLINISCQKEQNYLAKYKTNIDELKNKKIEFLYENRMKNEFILKVDNKKKKFKYSTFQKVRYIVDDHQDKYLVQYLKYHIDKHNMFAKRIKLEKMK